MKSGKTDFKVALNLLLSKSKNNFWASCLVSYHPSYWSIGAVCFRWARRNTTLSGAVALPPFAFHFCSIKPDSFSRDGWHPETEDTLPFRLWFLRFGQKKKRAQHSTDKVQGSTLSTVPCTVLYSFTIWYSGLYYVLTVQQSIIQTFFLWSLGPACLCAVPDISAREPYNICQFPGCLFAMFLRACLVGDNFLYWFGGKT